MFELDRIRRRKLPPASIALGALTLALYAIETVRFGPFPHAGQLLELGASEHRAIWSDHQLWRLLCPAFLHGSVQHIAMNGYSFVQLAPFVERIWGSGRFLAIYVVTAIAGCALSSSQPDVVSVGASGALFGLMGFLVAAAYTGAHRHEVQAVVKGIWGQGLLLSIGGVLYYGFLPGTMIDNRAHLGGLIAGAILGLVLVETEEDDRSGRTMGLGAALAIAVAWGALLLDLKDAKRFDEAVTAALVAADRGDYASAVDGCERALLLRPHDPRAPSIVLLEGYSELRAGRLEEAGYALERAWRTTPSAETAAFLVELALRKKDQKGARSWAQECRRSLEGPPSSGLKKELAFLAELQKDPDTAAAVAAIGSHDVPGRSP